MASECFVARGTAKDGPYTGAQLKELASQGRIGPNDTLRKEGMANWVSASLLKGLLPDAARGPHGPPPLRNCWHRTPWSPSLRSLRHRRTRRCRASRSAMPRTARGGTNAGTAFRVMKNGVPTSALSVEEILKCLENGLMSPSDLIGVEAWVPLSTFLDLGVSHTGAGPAFRWQKKPHAHEESTEDDGMENVLDDEEEDGMADEHDGDAADGLEDGEEGDEGDGLEDEGDDAHESSESDVDRSNGLIE